MGAPKITENEALILCQAYRPVKLHDTVIQTAKVERPNASTTHLCDTEGVHRR